MPAVPLRSLAASVLSAAAVRVLAALVPGAVTALLADPLAVADRVVLFLAVAVAAAVASSVVTTALVPWTAVLWAAAGLGVLLQLRLDATTVGAAAVLLVAGGWVFAVAGLLARGARSRLRVGSGTALALVLAALALRMLPAAVPGGDPESGRLPVPVVGSVQIGEFTRLLVIVAVALALAAARRARDLGATRAERIRPVLVVVLAVAQILLVAVVDAGPAVITAVGCVVVAVAVRARRGAPRRPGRRLVLAGALGIVAVVVVGGFVLTSTTIARGMLERAVARIASLDTPDPQLALARAAVAEGGIVGSGLGTSALSPLVPAGRSDHAIAVLAADLGVFVVASVVVAIILSSVAVVRRLEMRDRPSGWAAAAILSVSAVQLVWATLGSFAIAPVTGVSAPWLAATGTALVSTALGTGIAFALARARVREEAGVLPDALRVLAAAVAIAAVVVALGPWPRDAFVEVRERGAIATRDGEVLAEGGRVSAVDPDGARAYPGGATYAAVTGRTFGLWGSGHTGVEATSAALLACGAPLPWWSFAEALIHPVPCAPADVVTSIDGAWQRSATDAMAGRVGAATVLDAHTGDTMVLVDTTLADPATWTPDVLAEPLVSFDAVAPGSVVKPLVAAVALEEGVRADDAPRDVLPLPDAVLVNSGHARCVDTSIAGAIEQSCNTVFGELAVRLTADRLGDGLSRHFLADSALVYDGGAVAGITTDLSTDTTEGQLARTGIGQESMRATPLAIASAYAALVAAAEGSVPSRPRLVAATCADGLHPLAPHPADVVPVSRDAAAEVLEGMRRAVWGLHGTMTDVAEAAEARGLQVTGKSGTAEVPSSVSSTGIVYWATVIVESRYVLTVQVRDAQGANAATAAAADILRDVSWRPAELTCP